MLAERQASFTGGGRQAGDGLVADDGSDRSFFSHAASRQLQEALEKLKSASAVVSVSIKEELAGSNDQMMLERLYCAKGGLTCAIEEAQKYLHS